jgi:hypothetical protein
VNVPLLGVIQMYIRHEHSLLMLQLVKFKREERLMSEKRYP